MNDQKNDVPMIEEYRYESAMTHAMKSIVTTCAMLEAEDGGYSGNYLMYGRSYREGDHREMHGSRRGYYDRMPGDMREDDRIAGQR